MISHIISDQKFLSHIIFQFESVDPGKNIYYFIGDSRVIKNIKIPKEASLVSVSKKELLSNDIIKEINKSNFLFIHFLKRTSAELVLKCDKTLKIVWGAWGGDTYNNNFSLHKKLYFSKTRLFSFYNNSFRNILRVVFPYIYFFMTSFNKRSDYSIINKAIQRVNFCAPIIPNEFELIKNAYKTNFTFVKFSVGNIKNYLAQRYEVGDYCNGENIIIGNSSSETNNHFEIIDKLRKLNLNNRKVYAPLSYGSKSYRKKIIKYGQKKIPNNFYPLIEFLPISEYNSILYSCSIAIFNHKRQQAVGNIIVLLWIGVKVFLSRSNPLFKFLKQLDIIVFSIEDELVIINLNGLSNLKTTEQEHNRKKVEGYWGEEKVLRATKELIIKVNES